jgi:hypothetical protein
MLTQESCDYLIENSLILQLLTSTCMKRAKTTDQKGRVTYVNLKWEDLTISVRKELMILIGEQRDFIYRIIGTYFRDSSKWRIMSILTIIKTAKTIDLSALSSEKLGWALLIQRDMSSTIVAIPADAVDKKQKRNPIIRFSMQFRPHAVKSVIAKIRICKKRKNPPRMENARLVPMPSWTWLESTKIVAQLNDKIQFNISWNTARRNPWDFHLMVSVYVIFYRAGTTDLSKGTWGIRKDRYRFVSQIMNDLGEPAGQLQ